MQKNFVIIDNDILLKNLIEDQISSFFKKKFKINFQKINKIENIGDLEIIDLILINFMILRQNKNFLTNLDTFKKTKIIIMFDDGVDRFEFKKYSKYNFVVKPFKLKQLINIITDFYTNYETNQKTIKITSDLVFKPEIKLLISQKNKLTINLTEKESKLLNYIIENKDKVLKKHEILVNVWGINQEVNTHTLETHIYSLKKKLDYFKYDHTFIYSDHLGGYYFKNP